MADARWYISIDGQQEGDFSLDDVKQKVQKNQGRRILVWTQGMSQWADPAELPQFKTAPAPAPAPVPVPPSPAPAPAAESQFPAAHIDKDELKKQAGILKALLDFKFQTFATLKIIPIVYVILMVVIGLLVVGAILISGIGGLISAIRLNMFSLALTALGTMILAPLLGILYLAILRMSFELMIVIFRIKEDLSALTARTEEKEEKK
jgi:uncharacterized protein DUF4282/uncharacterized protein DUF4339